MASEPGASLETAVALQDGAVPPDALAGRTVRERREDALDRRAQLGGAEAEQGGEPSHRVAAPVEAEHELVEMVVEMIRPDAMMRAVDVPPWPHVHVTGNGGTAKIWLRPVELEKSRGYPDPQIGRILRIAGEHQAEWLAEWEKRCGSN